MEGLGGAFVQISSIYLFFLSSLRAHKVIQTNLGCARGTTRSTHVRRAAHRTKKNLLPGFWFVNLQIQEKKTNFLLISNHQPDGGARAYLLFLHSSIHKYTVENFYAKELVHPKIKNLRNLSTKSLVRENSQPCKRRHSTHFFSGTCACSCDVSIPCSLNIQF